MKRLVALMGLFLMAVALAATPAPAQNADKPKSVDVVLCLDVSGSMQGLIESAKNKLWDIVNDLARIKPTPDLRVALYSYGHTTYDAKAGWVRKEVDLTTDLDVIYQKLNALTINGGNEYVARVTRDAIDQQKWSEDKNALKIIFVCGNEPASQDPMVKLGDVAQKAVARDIIINTIFCGNPNDNDARDWKEYAAMCKGQYFSIDQDRSPVVINTPFDKELNDLSGQLGKTYLAYGAKGREALANQQAQDATALRQGAGVAAGRAETKATGLYRNDAWDLVDRIKNDKNFDIKKVPVEELCDELKKLTPEQREAFVQKKLAEREELQKKVAELGIRRQAYIREQQAKNPSQADQAFDAAVRGALRQQAATKGIRIPE